MVTLVALTSTAGCRPGAPAFVELGQARRAAADLRVHLNKAADASNRAVMADTDEASMVFARDAEALSRLVESDMATLASALRSLHFPTRFGFLESSTSISRSIGIGQEHPGLAVENTNLKAQRLTFDPLREVADGFRTALESIVGTLAPKDRCRIEGFVAGAVLAVRDIQVLHAPHIAESDAATMTASRRWTVCGDGRQCRRRAVQTRRFEGTGLAVARKEFDRFKEISSQIVVLSRRNSNVRSFDLALRTRPPLTAACDDSVRSLQDALAKEGSKATR